MGERRQEKLPLVNNQASGAEPLGGASPVAMNVIVDPTGSVSRRPGIVAWCPSVVDAEGVFGIYETTDGPVFAVGGVAPPRVIYRVSDTGATALMGLESNLAGSARPVFAETDTILAIAGGQEIQKVTLDGIPVSSRLGGTPPLASHVIANGLRLLANDVVEQKDFVFYSEQLNYDNWFTGLSTGQFAVDARPDPVVALWENSNEICAFGTTSYQTFAQQPDLTNPVASVTALEMGLSAVYSVVKIDEQFGWLDHLRRFIISDGRSVTVISDPIQKTLHDMATVSDCFGYRVTMGFLDAFVWTFPTEGRTFCYQKSAGWSQWSTYSSQNQWGQFAVTAAAKLREGDRVLVAVDGSIGQLSFSAQTDLGQPISAYIETGFIDHGTDNRKTVKKLTLVLRRGQTIDESDAPQLLISWRDSLGAWEPGIPVSLGATGESYPVVEFYSLGVYRRRQWRIEFMGPEALSLVSVTEDFSTESN